MFAILYSALLALAVASPIPQDEPAGTSPVRPEPRPLVFLHPTGNKDKCVDISGANMEPGTTVQM